ncbi:peptide ABC transporter substrate-binding protein [Ferroacidibacillus organovorans]|uniref:ABC transporter substrate-binding protein n=1 Tax=Ferroacidibacillus organovorans TaxID=1765683 RepID=A0A1V4ETR3_9BACL|nr:peptide ABC transporter substrate-binding protein [Ferroacidibacillus organovorans]OPG16291.1 ABC transporter substrate-binding protein [Ferroacidibacillus organovorans]
MKINKSFAVTLAMVASTSLLLAPTSFAASKAASAKSGGTIEYALPSQTNLNWFLPVTNAANDSVYNTQFVDQMYKPLLWINNNYSINWKSSIASRITYNPAGTIYHIFMNPKWKWSNGKPVTSQDVLFTWNVIKAASASNAPTPWPFVGAGTGNIPNGIKSVVANNKYELTITLDKPANQQWFMYNGIIQLTPMPSAVWNKYKNITQEIKYLGANATNPMFDTVVDGPFKVQSGTPSQSWVLIPNKNYPGHKSTVNKVVFNFEASNTAELAALKTGSINVGYLDQSELGSKGSLTSMGDSVTPEYPFGIFWTEMNMWPGSPSKSIFDQLYVRQALQMGIDNAGISKDIYKGYAVPIDGPIATVPKTTFISPTLAAKNPYPFNLAAGKRLLEAHGWKLQNGVMTKGNQKLKFTMMYVSGTTSSTDAAEIMQQDWASEGVVVTLKPMPFSSFISTTSDKTNHSWQLAVGSGWDYNGPGFYPTGGQLFASTAPSGTGFSNVQEDKLIQATHIPYATSQQTMSHFFAYENYTANILPFLWGQNVATLVVTAPSVHNVLPYLDAATAFPQMQYWTASGN